MENTTLFFPREDSRSRELGVFQPSISRPYAGVKLLSGPVSTNQRFYCDFSLKRVSNTIELMIVFSKLHDPQKWA